MKQERIVISNLAETFTDFLAKDQKNINSLIEAELSLDDQAVLWEGDNSIIITSHQIEPVHLEHLKRALGYNSVTILSPKTVSSRLSNDILADQELFGKIIEATTQARPTTLTPYSVTPEFVALVENLLAAGAKITVPELPAIASLWLVRVIDHKSGFRRIYNELLDANQARMPRGFSCSTLEQVVSIVSFFSKNGTPCIVKPDDGEDGMGQLIFSASSDTNDIVQRVSQNPFLRDGNAVVEEYIEPGEDGIVSPSVEYRITDQGLHYLYSCKQALSATGTFLGVDIGPEILPPKIKRQMIQLGNSFGGVLQKLGYRGFFDIDFVVGKNESLYAVEANLRRTGATHVHAVGTRLFGQDYQSKVFLRSSDVDNCIPNSNTTCEEVLSNLDEILYPNLGKDKGVIITVSAGVKRGRLGYIIVGETLREIETLQKTLRARLE